SRLGPRAGGDTRRRRRSRAGFLFGQTGLARNREARKPESERGRLVSMRRAPAARRHRGGFSAGKKSAPRNLRSKYRGGPALPHGNRARSARRRSVAGGGAFLPGRSVRESPGISRADHVHQRFLSGSNFTKR